MFSTNKSLYRLLINITIKCVVDNNDQLVIKKHWLCIGRILQQDGKGIAIIPRLHDGNTQMSCIVLNNWKHVSSSFYQKVGKKSQSPILQKPHKSIHPWWVDVCAISNPPPPLGHLIYGPETRCKSQGIFCL